ncbi:MAG: recombinase RecA [Symbiobacteriaceae bacterium]|nr:recombinase RecA [Symbiobacteriaceae bacterium]
MPRDSRPGKSSVGRDATPSEKQTALQNALLAIEKDYGKGAIMRLGEMQNRLSVAVIPTGCLSLDVALGVGGVPRGRIIEIFGPESSGKTTVALHIIAEAQKGGGMAAFIDAEHALDPAYAAAIGVDTENLLIAQPDTGEQALEIVEALVRSGALDAIVVDSVAALVPKSEIDGEMGDSFVGLHARLMSQAMRKLAGAISRSHATVVFINQIREKIGGGGYGPSETTTGGRALKFYSSVRIDVRRVETLKQGSDQIGNRTRAKIAKNKVAPPFRVCEFDLMFGKGISNEGCVVDMATEFGVILKSGAWYSYNGDRLGQGRENVKIFLKDHPELMEELENKVRQILTEGKVQLPVSPRSAADDDDDDDSSDEFADLTPDIMES